MNDPAAKDTTADIPELLHEAQLLTGRVAADRRATSLLFAPLRRAEDGSDMDDQAFELRLLDTFAAAVAYDPPAPHVRPSSFKDDTFEPRTWRGEVFDLRCENRIG